MKKAILVLPLIKYDMNSHSFLENAPGDKYMTLLYYSHRTEGLEPPVVGISYLLPSL